MLVAVMNQKAEVRQNPLAVKSACFDVIGSVITLQYSKIPIVPADQKRPDARHPKFREVRRTEQYAATPRNEGNAADGRFSSAG
jgi:hypothetical protein